MKIGARIQALRRAQGYTLASLAERVGTSGPQIAMWQRGRCVPKLRHARRLAEAFGLTLDQLLDGVELDEQPSLTVSNCSPP